MKRKLNMFKSEDDTINVLRSNGKNKHQVISTRIAVRLHRGHGFRGHRKPVLGSGGELSTGLRGGVRHHQGSGDPGQL